jgi:type I site-specific restriction-modification system R (restriction) subunit
VRTTVESLMRPGVVLDILQNFTLFATDKKHRRIKVICRYQQYETTNKMIARVVAGYPKKGLIWHFQGSGKSLLMVFAAQKLRMHPRLGNPTVLIVVDRIDLDTQISATFNAADVPNMIGVDSREELQRLIRQDVRKVLITTIHKFGSPLQSPSPQPSPRGSGSNYRGGFEVAGLVERARELRQKQTPAEEVFWELCRNRQIRDAKFRRQHQIGDYIVDFYCHEARLVVEFDGPIHEERKPKDAKRDKQLTSLGNTVLRFTNAEFENDPESVLKRIADHLPSTSGRGARGEGSAWCERKNIIVMVDEAHRTQEGDLGRRMREALPNAFLFGLTGTPINRADRNTFWAFGADEDVQGYMSRYSFQDSIRDKATLPLHFEAPAVKLKIDKAAIDEAYKEITGDLSEQDRDDLAKRAAKMAVLVKNPERVRAVVEHIVGHYQTKVEPNGFKAQVVVFDRECCVLYKKVMDELIGPEASAIVMSSAQHDKPEWKEHIRDRDTEEKLLDRFRDAADPLKFVIVTSKLLTGFDAPILQVMYLDKPMKDHNLLQAICRVNRTYGQTKTHGLIVDYIGIFDDVARALNFDEKAVQQVVSNIEELRKELPVQMHKCLAFFPKVDRTMGGYEGLLEAQQHLPDNATRDRFAAEYSVLGKIWDALSPDPCLVPYEQDFKWLTQVYESVKPVSGSGRLLWHRLGAKTIDLINQNVHVEAVRDDIDAIVLDADVLDSMLKDVDPGKKARELEIQLIARLRKHAGDPKFKELGERLEKIRDKHEQGLLNSLEFLKAILEVAKDTVEAEKQVEPEEEQDRALSALTELFNEVKGRHTHVIVERIVADIDAIVKQVRFDGWQATAQGEREVKQALRRALLKYKLHTDHELFDKSYGYIREYY